MSITDTVIAATPVLSREQLRRVVESIVECDRYIAAESPRPADTRPAKAASHLAFCIAHRAKLQAWVAAQPSTR